MMEIQSGAQTLIGFPALIDAGEGVRIAVFDELESAQVEHRKGLKRLIRLHSKDAIKYLEKNIPELQKMSMLYLSLGTQDELREQIIELALERAFLSASLPQSREEFTQMLQQGRARLNLISAEIARLCASILQEYQSVLRKLKDSKPPAGVAEDTKQQLQRLISKRFIVSIHYSQLQHIPRYLKAILVRLDKIKTSPSRDEERMREVRALEQRLAREQQQRKGHFDAKLEEMRWMIEELRVSLFAQELRTPQPVSSKRIEKMWTQLVS
jgi:ATP-dependent helicase HrpA